MKTIAYDPPIVTFDDDGIRPNGKSAECLYCNQKIGQKHTYDCVTFTKKFVCDIFSMWRLKFRIFGISKTFNFTIMIVVGVLIMP